MPRPLPFNNTELNDVELNARTVDVIGDLNSLNKIHFPNSDLVSAINAVPNMMNRTFYVDAINGDDGNDGSVNAPFASIKKAVYSAPPGAVVNIHLKNDHTEPPQGKISLYDRIVTVHGYRPDGVNGYKYKLNFTIAPSSNTYNTVHGFRGGGVLIFSKCDIGFVDNSDPSLPFDSFCQVIDYGTGGLVPAIYLTGSKITIPDNSAITFLYSNSAGIGTVIFNCYNSEIVAQGSNSFAFKVYKSSLVLNIYSVTLSGAKTSIAEHIIGMVKDANGVPRNVLSNVIL